MISTSPQSPNDTVIEVPSLTVDQVQLASRRARAAGRGWSGAPASERAGHLHSAAAAVEAQVDSLTALIVREVGKPFTEARAEITRSVAILRYHAQQALDPCGDVLPSADGKGLLFTRRRPRGVAGLISPWNFPVAIPLWKAAPALAHGNTVLLKPSPEATATAARLGDILNTVLPPHVFTVVPGEAATGAAVVDTVDAVSFTGSERVGRAVIRDASARGIPAQAEMTGQNASILLADADIEQASRVIMGSAMAFAGQKCTATSRIIIVGNPSTVVEALVVAAAEIIVGDPADPSTMAGPVISTQARAQVLAARDQARAEGGRLLTRHEDPEGAGWWVTPTLVDGLAQDSDLHQREIFGPFATILNADDVEHAIALANNTRFGLVTSLFTRDLGAVLPYLDNIDSGLVRVNTATTYVDLHAPFGGERASSMGPREQGKAARDLYTSVRTITVAAP